MTSAPALEISCTTEHPDLASENSDKESVQEECQNSKNSASKDQSTRRVAGKKRPIPTPLSISIPPNKKVRVSVQRTHSPKAAPSPLTLALQNCQIQKLTPTVGGIKQVSNCLQQNDTVLKAKKEHSYVAMPTECTYEICSVLKWSNEKEALSSDDVAYREEHMNQMLLESSSTCPHVYLQHQNIKHIDRLLDFPKKAFATKQNPSLHCTINETRLLFQKLADQFWPGPVILFVPSQPSSPDCLIRNLSQNRQYIGFRSPSHPLAVKVLKQVYQDTEEPFVLVGSPIQKDEKKLLRARDVASKYLQSHPIQSTSKVAILHGEERKEIFAVPTCQFQDTWMECWIVPDKRAIILKGKNNRDVIPKLKESLRDAKEENRVVKSILRHWIVDDQRHL
eukprot:Nitzschia sp. Nitz4//scaffold79_size90958//27754//29011//NITZ4_005016-RA/size90958-augustus-gene-0.175-mRNA-1//-1//CDS//3329558222//9471//frame0